MHVIKLVTFCILYILILRIMTSPIALPTLSKCVSTHHQHSQYQIMVPDTTCEFHIVLPNLLLKAGFQLHKCLAEPETTHKEHSANPHCCPVLDLRNLHLVRIPVERSLCTWRFTARRSSPDSAIWRGPSRFPKENHGDPKLVTG